MEDERWGLYLTAQGLHFTQLNDASQGSIRTARLSRISIDIF